MRCGPDGWVDKKLGPPAPPLACPIFSHRLTLACGSAACAAAVAAVRRRLGERRISVELPGGTLVIEWRESDNHVLMTGLVELEYRGTFDAGLFAETV